MSVVCMLLTNDAVSDPRVEKEAVALSAAGHTVLIIAWNRSGSLPAAEEREGFRVIRVGPPSVHGAGLKNVGGYRGYWSAAANAAVEYGADVVHCHDADTIPAGLSAVRKLRRVRHDVKLVVDFHELYRDSKMVPQRGVVGGLARRVVERVERAGVRASDLVLVANPGTADYFKAMRPSELLIAENAPDSLLFRPDEGTAPSGDVFTVCFIGQKRYLRSLEVLMEAVGTVEGVEAVLAGGGVDEAAVARLAESYTNVRTTGRVKYADIPAMYRGCDAVYAVNDPGVGNMKLNFPVKAMEGMACGLPVIVSEGTWIGRYVEQHGIGIAVSSTPESVRAAIKSLREDPEAAREMGRQGRALVEAGLNWNAVADRIVHAYSRLL